MNRRNVQFLLALSAMFLSFNSRYQFLISRWDDSLAGEMTLAERRPTPRVHEERKTWVHMDDCTRDHQLLRRTTRVIHGSRATHHGSWSPGLPNT
jgi:hypothetical protein